MLLITAPLQAWQVNAPDTDCQSQANILRVADKSARQGATIAISAKRYYDMSERDLADKCVDRWEVSDPAAVTLSPDHRSLTIARDALPGKIVSVSYVAAGQRETIMLRIIGKDEPDLTGSWTQSGIAWCGGRPLGELKFTSGGAFTATVHPFESYVDHSGRYRWDPVTGVLVLITTRSASPNTVRGFASISPQGVLRIKGISFDEMTEAKDCENLFR